jgi:hypothetical protein
VDDGDGQPPGSRGLAPAPDDEDWRERAAVRSFLRARGRSPVIIYLTRRWGWKVALASALIGTAAAPMIFEFPFDLIVMTRTNPPIPTHPMLYRQLFFLPLFLVQLSTISLLTLLPSMRVTANACYAVAGMFVVFAVWAVFGFAFAAGPLPLALNVISKILCFVAAIMLFVWTEDEKVSRSLGRSEPFGQPNQIVAPNAVVGSAASALRAGPWH